MSKKRKAIVLIVEGITDEIAMNPIFKLIENHELFVKVVHGDVYSNIWNQNKPSKVIVGEIMKQVKQETKFKDKDIEMVLQIIDTDGIFVKKECYVVDEEAELDSKTYVYDLNESVIRLNTEQDKSKLNKTWDRKKRLVLPLIGGITYGQSKIPFTLYYNSLNLDHVITDKILSDFEKEDSALNFIESLNDNVESFIHFFDEKCPYDTYTESWNKIQEDDQWSDSKSNVVFLIRKIISKEQEAIGDKK